MGVPGTGRSCGGRRRASGWDRPRSAARCCLAGKDQGQAGPRTSGRADPGGWSRAQSAFRRGRRGAGKVDREGRGVWCLEASKDPVAGEIRRISGISTGFRTPAGISTEPPSAQNATPCAHFAPCLSCCSSVAFRPEARFDAETNPRRRAHSDPLDYQGADDELQNFRLFFGRCRNFPKAADAIHAVRCTRGAPRLKHWIGRTFRRECDSSRETSPKEGAHLHPSMLCAVERDHGAGSSPVLAISAAAPENHNRHAIWIGWRNLV